MQKCDQSKYLSSNGSVKNKFKVSRNPCDNHNLTLTVWKKAFTTFSLFLCTNRDWKL